MAIFNVAIFEFGSRSGTYFALALFGTMFAVLGWGVAREIRRRFSQRRTLAIAAGLLLFIGPVSMIYASSLSGFYEAELDENELRLLYIIPGCIETIPVSEIAGMEETYAFKSRWRLNVVRSTGQRYESATLGSAPVKRAAADLRARLKLLQSSSQHVR